MLPVGICVMLRAKGFANDLMVTTEDVKLHQQVFVITCLIGSRHIIFSSSSLRNVSLLDTLAQVDNACHISKRTTSSQFEQAAFIAISCSYRIFNSRASSDWDLLDHHIS